MITTSAFRRHYFISVMVIVVGLIISLAVGFYLSERERQRFMEAERDRNPRPPISMFRSVFLMSGLSAHETADELNRSESRFFFRILSWQDPEVTQLTEAQLQQLHKGGIIDILPPGRSYRPPLAPFFHKILGPLRGPPPGFKVDALVALSPLDGVLLLEMKAPPRGPPPNPLPLTLGMMFLGVIITTGIAISLMFSNYKSRAQTAESVLKELKSGNLSARLPVYKMDELSQLVMSFNHMADEIENLVNRVRQNEARRMLVLQQLAHDLRTPIASMRTFLESLKDDRARMTETQIQRALDLSFAESQYFERLVEDLLTLASLGEPGHTEPPEEIAWRSLIESVIEKVRGRNEHLKIAVEMDPALDGAKIHGRRKLLERMLRNGLENAVSFARSSVTLRLVRDSNQDLVTISDDGPGLDEKAFQEFGQLRKSRRVESSGQLRVSSGVGSVIMKEIAQLHQGQLQIANRTSAGQIQGADLTIQLPRA